METSIEIYLLDLCNLTAEFMGISRSRQTWWRYRTHFRTRIRFLCKKANRKMDIDEGESKNEHTEWLISNNGNNKKKQPSLKRVNNTNRRKKKGNRCELASMRLIYHTRASFATIYTNNQ